MEDRIELRFDRHAMHHGESGSWFQPRNPRTFGHHVFIYDSSVGDLVERLKTTDANVTHIKEDPYALPVTELNKAARERESWLNRQFVTVANRIHRQDRARPDDDYRFHSLHPVHGEWIARYNQRSTGDMKDYALTELKICLKGKPCSDFRDLLTAPIEKPDIRIPESDLRKGIRELTAIGPKIRAERSLVNLHI